MKHSTPSKIHSFTLKNGLYIRVNPVTNELIKIVASRLRHYYADDRPEASFIDVLDPAKQNVIETLHYKDHGHRGACTKEEFLPYEKII